MKVITLIVVVALLVSSNQAAPTLPTVELQRLHSLHHKKCIRQNSLWLVYPTGEFGGHKNVRYLQTEWMDVPISSIWNNNC